MGFKVVHTGQAKLVSKIVKKIAEMTFSKGWRISTMKMRYASLSDSYQSVNDADRSVMRSSHGDGGRGDMPALHGYQLAQI